MGDWRIITGMAAQQNDTPKRRRRRFQYSLRTLLLLVLLVSVGFSCLAVKFGRVRKRRELVAALELRGVTIRYAYEVDRSSHPPGPEWLRAILGDDFFAEVDAVYADHIGLTDEDLAEVSELTGLSALSVSGGQITDAGLKHLKGLANLRILYLSNTQVTDSGLEQLKGLTALDGLDLSYTQVGGPGLKHLKGLARLNILYVHNTEVTGAGVEELQKALPDAEIEY